MLYNSQEFFASNVRQYVRLYVCMENCAQKQNKPKKNTQWNKNKATNKRIKMNERLCQLFDAIKNILKINEKKTAAIVQKYSWCTGNEVIVLKATKMHWNDWLANPNQCTRFVDYHLKYVQQHLICSSFRVYCSLGFVHSLYAVLCCGFSHFSFICHHFCLLWPFTLRGTVCVSFYICSTWSSEICTSRTVRRFIFFGLAYIYSMNRTFSLFFSRSLSLFSFNFIESWFVAFFGGEKMRRCGKGRASVYQKA